MRLDIIRHGKTRAGENRLYCGYTDEPLSKRGETEISEFRSRGLYKNACLYFASTSRRAIDTLITIFGDIHIERIEELREYNFGKFELKSYETLKDDPEYITWILDSTGRVKCPQGESRIDFRERVTEGFLRLLDKTEGAESVCLVCHGGVIAEIMELLLPGKEDFYEWQPDCGRGYSLILEDRCIKELNEI